MLPRISNAKKAITSVTLLKEKRKLRLKLKVNIKTGTKKPNQSSICHHLGYPIVGDVKYGSPY